MINQNNRRMTFRRGNGSVYTQYQVANMLYKLRVTESTKLQARKSTDKAYVKSNNTAVLQKHLGSGHILAHCASSFKVFVRAVLSPYLNYHQPSLSPREHIEVRGKIRKRYAINEISDQAH